MSDKLCCIVCAGQPQFAEGLSLTRYCEAEHVVREFADGRNLAMDAMHLHELGVHRRVAVAVESFALMPEFIIGTARIATVFRRQAERFAQRYPLAFPDAVQVLQWHPYQERDPAMMWFRGLMLEQAALLDQPAG
jgi:hypothetical protein